MFLSLPSDPDSAELVQKVTFSPVSDSTGNKALIVTIKKVAPEGEEISRIMETPKRSSSIDTKKSSSSETKRKSRSSRMSADKSTTKSTMTEKPQEISHAAQTLFTVPSTALDSTPCLKHAAENISRKASDIHSEKTALCNNCSKSMLSYIFVVQDFLDSLAKEICGTTDSKNCLQCLRQETRLSVTSPDTENSAGKEEKKSKTHARTKSGQKTESSNQVDDSSKLSTHTKDLHRDGRKYDETSEYLIQKSLSQHRQSEQAAETLRERNEGRFDGQTALQSFSQVRDQQGEHQSYTGPHEQDPKTHVSSSDQQSDRQSCPALYDQHGQHKNHMESHEENGSYQSQDGSTVQLQSGHHVSPNQPSSPSFQQHETFRRSTKRQQPDFTESIFHQEHKGGGESSDQSFHPMEGVSSPFSDGVDGIVSTLSNVEREVYDSARSVAGWDGFSEPQEMLVSSASNTIPSEAFVTMCRNNAEALGCLVVGTSLLLSRTSRTLCVLVTDGVSNAFRGPLSSVFHVVQCVRSMNSLGTTKLALLEQPELGVSFEKLNVWRLVQFNKCVFLNPDTLVIQNCDELFCREELSAVPDIGWPDCFNSGVFLFVPSIQTFWQLLEFAEKRGSYDGGDQGLLNSYFNSWSEDINKKLSFIYNLMANVSYTYTPAFKQFGRNVKIVQFHGSFKPWHVKFFSRTGQISSESAVHPTYVQFVHIWLNIFRISALRQLSQEIKSYAQSQEVICAVELLRFFPLPTESEAEFFLTPPSVRLRLAERKLQKSIKHSAEAQRRKSAEFSRVARDGDEDAPDCDFIKTAEPIPTISGKTVSEDVISTGDSIGDSSIGDVVSELAASGSQIGTESQVLEKRPIADENTLPGAEIGNYQGMKAWEQGRMDYQGTDSSETIIKRLQYLMTQPK